MEARSPAAGRPFAGPWEPHWWAGGLGLRERVPDLRRSAAQPDTARLDRWRARYGTDGAARFADRLADLGLDEHDLSVLLAESSPDLAARVPRPAWADLVESAVSRAGPPRCPPVDADWRAAFAVPLRPFLEIAADELVSSARRQAGPAIGRVVDLDAVTPGYTRGLGRRLVAIAARVFVSELGRCAAARRLTGADGPERFADFVRHLAGPSGLAEVLTRYPVLARLIAETCRLAVESHLELLVRFTADRAALVELLLDGVEPGPVVAVEAGQGDQHRRHRSVTVLTFADGRKVVYRPRDVAAYTHLADVVDWLGARVSAPGLRTVAVVRRSGYGWLEFVDADPLPGPDGADRFYRRQGMLLALLHALGASDIHFENLIASGDQPVLVDLETLFHPQVPVPGTPVEPAAATLAASVHRTLLLPTMLVGEQGAVDLSGVGGDVLGVSPLTVVDWAEPGTDRMRLVRRARPVTGTRNRPRLGDRGVDPGDHTAALVEGFRLGYDAIADDRDGFAALLRDCADIETRVVFRHTRGYQILIDEATHPDVLRDGLDRDRMLDVLWTDSAADPLLSGLCPHEARDLWLGDVPLFTARPGAPDVHASDGRRLPGVLPATGLDTALVRLAGMGDADRRTQEWVITATLATRRPGSGHHLADSPPGQITATTATPERLLAAACAVGDLIVEASVADRDRVNWLGLELVDERQWLVLPMGAGLAGGYLGVALFLAQLAERSGLTHYGDLARQAISPVPALLALLAGEPTMTAAVGCGGTHGFGGIAYALARIAVLRRDAEVARWAESAVALAASAATGSDRPGWATGRAGCLAAMNAVHAELGLPAAARVAADSADRLVKWLEHTGPPPVPGFADGAAGIGWALARCSRYVDRGAIEARRALASVEAGPGGPRGWCAGTGGLLLAAACHDSGTAPVPRVRDLVDRPMSGDLSLCHGELGVIDVLTVLDAERFPGAASAGKRRAGLVLDALDRYGPTCGTPDGVSTPGLLDGLAGIGYGLLRLGSPERVPSVLLLEPTPAGVV